MMDQKDYNALLEELSELIDEGIQCVDSAGITFFYNKKMAELEGIEIKDALNKSFKEIYPDFPAERSTLLKAVREGEATINKQQTYFNTYGKEITTINTTVPIRSNGVIVGAVEVAKDVTRLKEMTNQIMEYQSETMRKGSRPAKYNRIKKYTFDDIIGNDEKIINLKENALKIASNPYPVLIIGETGTGKELFAQSIHFASNRADKPFLAQNCAALPGSLLESILFGTAKGGFTGATDRAGMFEQASGGTLLLDEINALPYILQSKLLRVLQENYIRRIGGTKDIPVDVRVIAISNEPLEKLIEEGTFRRDLYYRLNTITLKIPSLNERVQDIPTLAESFIKKHNKKLNKNVNTLSDAAGKKLMNWEYLGNIRELENIIISAMSTMGEETIMEETDIQLDHTNAVTGSPLRVSWHGESAVKSDLQNKTLPEKLKAIENEIIDSVMKENSGNVSKSAAQLGIKRQSLQYKLKHRGTI